MTHLPHTDPSSLKYGKIKLQLNGSLLVFEFPHQGNTAFHIQSIIKGEVYPSLTHLGFQPTRIIDIGANLGASALLFHSQYPGAAIDCFEPSSENFKLLRSNLSSLPKVSLHHFGLFNEDKKTILYNGQNQGLQHSIFPSAEVTAQGESIQLKDARHTLAGSIEANTLIKIDTEGCELPILERLAFAFDQLKIIYLEFHSEKDRIAMDALLGATHGLWHAAVKTPHRGDLCYVHRSLWENIPEIKVQRVH